MLNTHLYFKNENKPIVKIQQPKDNKPLDYESIKKIILEQENKHVVGPHEAIKQTRKSKK